jgi:maleylacetoacetate isomerase
MLKLYTYYRSVSTHRVRIALNYKGVSYEPVFIDEDRKQHLSPEYLKLNPQGLVPALVVEDRLVITQSFAILEYLEERYPERPLLPRELERRALVRSFAQVAVADLQPLNILRAFHYMRDVIGLPLEVRRKWYEHWTHKGLAAMESVLARDRGDAAFCYGDKPTLADVCLVPQVYNATVNKLDLSAYPNLRAVYRTCVTLAAFQAAAPDVQADRLSKAG